MLVGAEHVDMLYGPPQRAALDACVDLSGQVDLTTPGAERLARAEVFMTGWGCPKLDAAFLERTPALRAVFYAGGSVRGIVSDALWERGIILSTTNLALAESVAEYALGQVLLCLKHTWQLASRTRSRRTYAPRDAGPGNFGSTIGLISYGAIARSLRRKLLPFCHNVLVYDPFLTEVQAREEQVERVSLEDIFRRSDLVSCHTPALPATEKMLRREHFAAMKPGSTFLNTARGQVVAEEELLDVLAERPDLFAVLDVTYPEPPSPDSRLFDLPNVVVTPHIAGSMGLECRRMGAMAVDDLKRYLAGQEPVGLVRQELLAVQA